MPKKLIECYACDTPQYLDSKGCTNCDKEWGEILDAMFTVAADTLGQTVKDDPFNPANLKVYFIAENILEFMAAMGINIEKISPELLLLQCVGMINFIRKSKIPISDLRNEYISRIKIDMKIEGVDIRGKNNGTDISN